MIDFSYLFVILLIYTIVRDFYFHKTIGQLTDKLMSRNYGEYMQSQALTMPQVKSLKVDDEPMEDMNYLKEFN